MHSKAKTKKIKNGEVSAYRRRTLLKLLRKIGCPNSDHTCSWFIAPQRFGPDSQNPRRNPKGPCV